jgi:hypothetical protein
MDKKLVDALAENLNTFVRSSAIYDKVYDKTPSSYTRLHNLSLSPDNVQTLNNLPLKWMNELVRASARQNLNPHLLSYMIQNYIDTNTGHPGLLASLEEQQQSKPSNLIGMAADIMKVEQKLASLAKEDGPEAKKSELVKIVSEINDQEKPSNLISMAADILKVIKQFKLVVIVNALLQQ